MELGAGSHSVVYLAKLQGMDVAVKVCRPSARGCVPCRWCCCCGALIRMSFPALAIMPCRAGQPARTEQPPACLALLWPCTALQVCELLPGTDSRAIWREVSILRSCAHERIVPLFGVALKVWPAACSLAAHLVVR